MLAVAIAIASRPAPAICFPWSIDMYRGPEIQPYAMSPRVTPADTIPVHGGEPPMSLEQAATTMHNPLQPTPENLARAKCSSTPTARRVMECRGRVPAPSRTFCQRRRTI